MRSNDAFVALQTPAARRYAVNGLNEYVSVNASAYSYDASGNLTNDGSTAYSYDAENRLIEHQTYKDRRSAALAEWRNLGA